MQDNEPGGTKEPKYQANVLVLGKSEDSVLNTFIGLEEWELAQGLADPLDCMEKEWYPHGFVPLNKETKPGDKGYGDAEYLAALKKAESSFEASDYSQSAMEEFEDEKERLQDDFEERRWKWWIAGANFDYIRFGTVGDPDMPDPEHNFWLPPQV